MDKKIKKAGIILFLYLLYSLLKLVISDELYTEMKRYVDYSFEQGMVWCVKSNVNQLNYLEDDDYDITRKLVGELQSSNGFFDYVQNEMKDIELVVYDPNIVIDDSKDLINAEEPIIGNGVGDTDNIGNNNQMPVTYSIEELSDYNFLLSNLYIVTERANVYPSDLDANTLLNVDLKITGGNDKPQILIYHTHSHEGFSDTTGQDNSTNIVAVGTYLAEVLSNEYGYNVIHCTESFDEVGGVFDRSKAYTYATPAIEQILKDNPSIEVVLDIHRDGIPEDSPKLITTINGKQTAKIMFFNGISRNDSGEISYLYNPYRTENLAMSFQMKLKAMEMYSDFTRPNYIDDYQYNLHLRGKSMLVEVGAQNNTFEEAKNAMEPLAEILNSILQGEQ